MGLDIDYNIINTVFGGYTKVWGYVMLGLIVVTPFLFFGVLNGVRNTKFKHKWLWLIVLVWGILCVAAYFVSSKFKNKYKNKFFDRIKQGWEDGKKGWSMEFFTLVMNLTAINLVMGTLIMISLDYGQDKHHKWFDSLIWISWLYLLPMFMPYWLTAEKVDWPNEVVGLSLIGVPFGVLVWEYVKRAAKNAVEPMSIDTMLMGGD